MLNKITLHSPAILVIIAFSLVLFWPIPFADCTIAVGDTLQQFYPWTQFWVQEFKTQGYPYWNPYSYGGTPFLGNLQIAPFYPTSFVLPLIDPLKYFGWTFWLHTLFAGFAMYLLIYWLVEDRIPALAMGLVYLSSGFLMTRISDGHVTIVNGLPWIPLALWAFMRWSERPGWGRWLVLMIFLTFQLAAGQPQIPYMTLFLLGLVAVNRGWTVYRAGGRNLYEILTPVIALLLATFCAIALTAPIWLPFKTLNELSAMRSAGISFEAAAKDSLQLRHLFSLLAPFLLGDPSGKGFWGSVTGYQEICGFVGLGTLLFALLALFSRSMGFRTGAVSTDRAGRIPGKTFWIVCTILMLVVAAGYHTPVYKMLYLFLPGLRFFRVPSRFLLLYTVCLCVLGGLGMKVWLRDWEKQPSLSRKLILFFTGLVVLVLVGGFYARNLALQPLGVPTGLTQEEIANRLAVIAEHRADVYRAVGIAFIFIVAWAIIFYGARYFHRKKEIYGYLLILLLVVEMGWFAHRFIVVRPTAEIISEEYPCTPTLSFLKEHVGSNRVLLPDAMIGWYYRKEFPEVYPNRLMVHGIAVSRGLDATFFGSYAAYIYRMQGIHDDRFLNIFLNVFDPARINPRLLSALAVRYIVTPVPLQRSDYKLVFEGPPLVYEYTRAFPRAYILPPDLTIPESLPGDATAEIVLDTPNRIDIQAELSKEGWLVLADNDYCEWRATANGQPVAIQQVLGTFRGIYLGSGKYDVVMEYRSFTLRSGLAIALATLLFLYGASACWRRRHSSGERADT